MRGYEPQSEDTTVAVDQTVFEGFRCMTPQERLGACTRAFHAAMRLSMAGLRLRYPQAGEEELRRRCGAPRLGPELTRRASVPS